LWVVDSAITNEALIDIRAMEATIAGRSGPYRKGDELVERLIRLPSEKRLLGVLGIGVPSTPLNEADYDPNGACRPLREGGFAVIAILVRGLDDKRLTRRNGSGLMRVDQVCSEFLEDIIGRETVGPWKLPPVKVEGFLLESRAALPKKKVHAWWEKARKFSEEEYYARSVLTLYKNENSKHHLQFLARKYPKALLPLYRKLLGGYPERDGADLLAAVMNSKLPGTSKREALLAGLIEGNRRQHDAALRQLFNLMPGDLIQLLLAPIADAKVKKTK
jgi:hypothetical protein